MSPDGRWSELRRAVMRVVGGFFILAALVFVAQWIVLLRLWGWHLRWLESRSLSVEELRSEVETLRRLIESEHPRPFQFVDR